MDKEMFDFKKNALMGSIAGSPLCKEYSDEWRVCGEDKEKLIKLVLRQQSIPFFITACHNGLGLSKDYIKDTFKDYINGRRTIQNCDGVEGYTYGLFVDYNGIVGVTSDVSAFMWCKDVTLIIPNTKCPNVYCGCHTNMHIIGNGYNHVRIYAFDESKVTIDDIDGNSVVTVLKYSKEAKVQHGDFCLGTVHEFNKELRL